MSYFECLTVFAGGSRCGGESSQSGLGEFPEAVRQAGKQTIKLSLGCDCDSREDQHPERSDYYLE